MPRARYGEWMGVIRGGTRAEPTQLECEIASALERVHPGLDYWLHEDPDGTPWMLVSLDIMRGGVIVAAPRIDIDTNGARGGLSPAMLNWDDGVRAEDAGIDTTGLGGFDEPLGPDLVDQAALWFLDRADSFT